MVSLPAIGMIFAYLQPPGLIEPPPIQLSRVWPLVGRTFALATLVSVLSLCLGTMLGYAQARVNYLGRVPLSILSILPLAIPSYLIAAIVRESFAPNNVIGRLLGTTEAFTGFWPSVLVLTIACTPYVQILVAAALTQYIGSEEEAARSLGASPWRRFVSLHVPRLRPTWSFALVLVALYVISDFGAVAILDCRVLTWELYQARGARDAVVLGFAIMGCVIPLLVAIRLLAGREGPRRHLGRARPQLRERWSIPSLTGIYTIHVGVIFLGIALPVGTLIQWVWSGWTHGVTFAPLSAPTFTTFVFTLCGAMITLCCALLPAWVVARKPGRTLGAWMEHGTYLTSAVPGILLAYGMLHLLLGAKRTLPFNIQGESVWGWIEGAGIVLMLGYMMRFLAEGYAALKPAVLSLDIRQEESAKMLGAGPMRRWWKVTLPLLAPGFGAAYLLLFLSIAKELPVTLMLTPTGYQTLAYRVFDAQREASLYDVGAAGLVLLLLAFTMQFLIRRGQKVVANATP